MSEHILTSFDTDLENLRRAIAEMGGIAEKMVADATTALVRRDTALAQAVIAADLRLDALQRDVEERTIVTIARRAPLAVDLRATISAMSSKWEIPSRSSRIRTNLARRTTSRAGSAELPA